MARPQTKQDLCVAAKENYDKLRTLIASMSDVELETPYDFSTDAKKKEAHWGRDKNLRDVVIHLYEWHNLLLQWIDNNRQGIHKQFLMEGYNWKSYGDMNLVFWKRNQSVSLKDALETLDETHNKVMAEIESFSNEKLFMKNCFDWVGGSTLGSYFVSVTSSHYDWAMKKIKAHRKIVYGR